MFRGFNEWVAVCLLTLVCVGGAGCAKTLRTLRVFDDLPTTLNPLYATTEQDLRAQELVYERVFYRLPKTAELQSDLVREYAYRAERKDQTNTELAIALRADRRWAKGPPVGPEDLCFTVEAILNPANDVAWAGAHREVLAGCDVEADRAIVRFRRPVVHPREWLMVPLLPAHRFKSTVIPPDHPAATQAYGIRNTEARLLVDHAWVEVVKKKEAPYIKRVEIRPMESVDWALEQVELGQAQGIVSLPAAFWDRAAEDITLTAVNFSQQAWWFIAVNTQRGPGSVPNVRKALDLMVDRRELLAQLDGGSLCLSSGGEGDNGSCKPPDDANPVTTLISGPYTPSSPYYDADVPVVQPDMAHGAQILEEMGWERTEGWLRDGEPVTLRVGISSGDQDRQPGLLAALAGALQKAGFTVETEVVAGDWPGRNEDVANRFDLFIGRWQERRPGPQIHALLGADGADNLFAYQDEAVEAFFAKSRTPANALEERSWTTGLHGRLAEDRPLLFLWSKELRSVWRREFRGVLRPTPVYYYTEFNAWRWAREW